ncbi:MAG: S-methyl-5-thioribose-1-phosphate isomerase [Chloroflexi bacterium RBG_16_52_11]|nr:MAG: S-methyl-5-thioribose-1-phosphate isomerase [Chloroflexi bacterium RBG_16_52_11]
MRTVEWDYERGCLRLIDQRLLPGVFAYRYCEDYQQVARSIQEMVVRGAPAIGATAAFGLALAAQRSPANDLFGLRDDLRQAAQVLRSARPTAVNLEWALRRILEPVDGWQGDVDQLRAVVLDTAQRIADEDVEINRRMSQFGAALLEDGDTVIHHCNTGALATVDWGTALGVVRMAHEMGKQIFVLVDETRPRLQGSRLTAWELEQYGIPYAIISDAAAGYFLRSGQAQKVLFGADRVAANGDVANKIGTYMLALAAHDNSTPVYAVLPTSTIDLSLPNGDLIAIEQRGAEEVLSLQINGSRVAPEHAAAKNPAFDITPHHLLTAMITECGVIYPPFAVHLPQAMMSE